MRSFWVAPALLAVASAADAATDATAAATDSATGSTTTAAHATAITIQGTRDPMSIDVATGSVTYESVTTTTTVPTASITAIPTASNGNSSETSTSSDTKSLLVGSQTSSATESGTATSATPAATNTQPCNGYVEFCDRSYSNITYVTAHNSPFDRKGNLASNQQYDVTAQLNDGVRMRMLSSPF